MMFKLGELFCGANGLARGEALRRVAGFTEVEAGAIRSGGEGIRKMGEYYHALTSGKIRDFLQNIRTGAGRSPAADRRLRDGEYWGKTLLHERKILNGSKDLVLGILF